MAKKIQVKSYINQEEYEYIIKQAKLAGLSISAFVKQVCLNEKVAGIVDQEAVLSLLQTKADLGRLGGLFKQYLLNSDEKQASKDEIRALLKNLEAVQNKVAAEFTALSQTLLKG